jgi:outer membrane protein OmpA-like peptidoglycan-associated protein
MNRIFFVIALAAASAAAGCQTPEPESPAAGLTQPVDPPKPPDLGRGADRTEINAMYNLWLTDSVRTVCSGPAPFFQFDSAETAGSQPTMQTLVNCMISGPLKGKSIQLIGHTDPRGTPNYNDKLGLERAERVKRYLVANGVEAARVMTSSVGEDEASPAPQDWPKDRRVEIQLAK